ncbi:Coiled-coil and C2 domain-containing protein 2A [Hypsibius exemplaris]|uniref:Coiled-coil and C2 domain-containing protein 2A n=1 Tax=Hypsibius exemplaris TaxID=2072580 RepID=A0A1W0WCN1_HYPEX|nr:Coiled-coil and C2 domain-containing protein 2A [Hypsibius exemplaris]
MHCRKGSIRYAQPPYEVELLSRETLAHKSICTQKTDRIDTRDFDLIMNMNGHEFLQESPSEPMDSSPTDNDAKPKIRGQDFPGSGDTGASPLEGAARARRARSVHFADANQDDDSAADPRKLILQRRRDADKAYGSDSIAEESHVDSDFFTTQWAVSSTPQFLTSYLSPLYIPNANIKSSHAQNCYLPKTSAPDIASQFDHARPISREEDGLYVGQRPAVARVNQNCMENRMITEKALHWIDQEWRLKALPDPVCLLGSRCQVEHERDVPSALTAMSTALLDNLDVLGRKAPKRLEMLLEFRKIEFQHHYLFSLEHVYVMKMRSLFDGHMALLEENLTGQLAQRIGGLKIHLESLKKAMEIAVTDDLKGNLRSCIRDLLLTRLKYDEASRTEQLSLIELVGAWSRLKQLRITNTYTNTPDQLVLRSQPREQTADLDAYQQDITDELHEREILFVMDMPDRIRDYERDLSEWQGNYSEWEKAQREVDTAIRDNRQVVSQEVAHLAAQPAPVQPDPPKTFNRRDELRLIEQRIAHSRRKPGDPVYIPTLKADLVTESTACPAVERDRRAEVAGQRLFVRVIINDREVCRTVSHHLNADFTVSVGKTFGVLVEYVPESIKVEVYEESGLRNRKLAETFIPVPDVTDTFESAEENAVEFSSSETVAPSHNAVGSGVTTSELRYTTGKVFCKSAWTTAASSRIAEQTRLHPKSEVMGPRGIRDMKKLAEWVQNAKLDPNDPAYAELVYFIKNFDQAPEMKYFRLEQLQEEFDFCPSEDIANNRRFQVLQLRDRQVADFADWKMVPPTDEEIPALMLAEHKRRMQQEASSILGNGNSKRQQYTRMLQKLREYISTTVYAAESVHTYEDLVNEEPILTFGKFFEVLTQFWKPRERLKPVRKRRKTVSVKQLGMVEMQLLIRVIGATFLPVRREVAKSAGRVQGQGVAMNPLPGSALPAAPQLNLAKTGNPLGASVAVLHPFIIIQFAGQEKRLSISSGSNPMWNEQVSFRIRPSAKSSLQFLKQEIEIHFYDEVSVDVLEDDMLRKTHVFQRLDRRWLGSLSFSFTDLYTNSVLEGTFPLNSPPVLLGYGQTPVPSTAATSDRPVPQATVFITLDPPLTPPTPLPVSKLESTELDSLVDAASAWTTALTKQFPERWFQPMVVNTEAKSCLATRFIRPLNIPPALVVDSAPTLDKMNDLAKYVARIPYVSDTLLFPEAVDIWTTNDQFLNLQCGDDEEHALLLLSYFLYLKTSAYLILGNPVTGRSGAYVLTKAGDSDGWLIWDATTGRSYQTDSINCPLKDVGIVVDATNVWANVQHTGSPRQMQWLLTNTVNWKPFWPAKQPATGQELISAQPEAFTYESVPFGLKQELEILLKNQIVTRVMEERTQYITRWNIECDRRLYALLGSMEQDQLRGTDLQAYHERELRDLLVIYEIYGFPLNIPFTNTDGVTDIILATGVHKIDSNDVEFSVAVNVTTYPHSVISLWVYFVVLLKRH